MGLKVEADHVEQEAIEIMPVNHASFEAFLACQTQWRVVATMDGLLWIGLDYNAVRTVLDDLNAPKHVFADLRMMEAEVLPLLNEGDA